MKTNHKTLSILIAAAGVAVLAFTLSTSRAAKKSSAAPSTTIVTSPVEPIQQDTIQVALLLDTSGSMSGLINQARTQMWKLVNEVSRAERDGRRPRIEIALYEYGKPSLGEENGFIRQLVPLTMDLDRVSEALFSLTTDGGDEFAGQVISRATRELEWNDDPNQLKLLFIAGNEGFEQGPIDYRSAVAAARERGIVVNTIYCGDADDPVRAGWQNAATLAAGRALHIDHNQAIVQIAAPQDAEIAELGVRLNGTYMGYGSMGMAKEKRQEAQDSNAAMAGSMVARSVSKASAVYDNSDWDLIDGLDRGAVKWDQLEEGELPDDMRSKSREEREALIESKRQERKELQERIRVLSIEREKYVAARRAEMGEEGGNTLDAAMLEVLGELATEKGFDLD